MRNLFICFTPFHLKIAYSIITQIDLKYNDLIYLPSVNNSKNKYYFKKSLCYFDKCKIRVIKNNYAKDLYFLINNEFRYKNYDYIFTGNLKTIYSRIILSNTQFRYLNTYDDGIGHYYESPYFNEINEKFISKILLRKNFHYKNLLNIVTNHYTIFKDSPIINNIKIDYHSLLNNVSKSKIQSNVTVLLSGNFSNDGIMSEKEEKLLYESIINNEKIDYIILHPSQKNNISNLKEIGRNTIVEDLIKSGYVKGLIGCNSTSLITSKIIKPSIKCINYNWSNNQLLEDLFLNFGIITKTDKF